MHEKALMDDVIRKVVEVAYDNGGVRVVRVSVWLGALSHFTPEHFREHFAAAARGTPAEDAEIDAVLDVDPQAPNADRVMVESVEVEPFESPEIW
jgi:hydrogenase nickel incorporation protein HypA/HybF